MNPQTDKHYTIYGKRLFQASISGVVSYDTMHHLYELAMPKRQKTKPMKRVTVTVDPDDFAALDQLSQRSDVSASWLVRRSMREFLQRHRDDRQIDVTFGRGVA